jgi:hypothetical protein
VTICDIKDGVGFLCDLFAPADRKVDAKSKPDAQWLSVTCGRFVKPLA